MTDYPEGKPCWAPGAAEYLESLLTGEEIGLEWGGGASSVWLALRVKELCVFESDPGWARWLQEEAIGGLIVFQMNWRSDYYTDPLPLIPERPNLWLIDGYRRIDCLEVVEKLKKSGDIIVCDDSADYLDGRAPSHAKTFSQPHPHAGIPINHAKYGALRNTLLKVHHDTKDTTIWVV